MTANGRGRKLQPRSDTERLELLVKLLGFGRGRQTVSLTWHVLHGVELYVGPVGDSEKQVAFDEHGDLRALLDRALSKNAGAKKRAKRRGA